MLNTRFIETRMFKEVPGGFIFQLPPLAVGRATGHIEDMPAIASVFLGFCSGFLTLILASIVFTLRKRAILRPLIEPLPRAVELLFPVGPKPSWTDFRWVRRRAAPG